MRYTIGIGGSAYGGIDGELTASYSDKINVIFTDEEQERSALFSLTEEEARDLFVRLGACLERVR